MTSRTLDLNTEKSEQSTFKPIPQGTYEFEIGEASVKVPKKTINDKGAVSPPFVEVQLTIFGGTLSEKGRNFKHRLFLGMNPGTDGKLNYKREAGLLALFEAVGASKPEVEIIPYTATDENTGEEKIVDTINAQQVAEIVNQSLRGGRGKCYIRVKAEVYNGKTEQRNELSRFNAPVTEGN